MLSDNGGFELVGYIPDTRTPDEKQKSHERALATLQQLKEQSRRIELGQDAFKNTAGQGSMIVLRRVQ